MRRLMGRNWRLELVTALGCALALPALALTAGPARGLATETSLATDIRDVDGHTQATLSIAVIGNDGLPVTGAVEIRDLGKPIAGVALNAEGRATSQLTLAPGTHGLTANFVGDTAHLASASQVSPVRAVTGTAPDFSISVSPATLSLKQGQSGAITAAITPINASSLTGPMFVTLSCSGLPDQSSCTYTPENLEVLVGATAAVNSNLVLATVASNTARSISPQAFPTNHISWAILLPGSLGLLGIALGARRRAWLSRMSLLGLVGFIAVLGTTGCNPLYNYKNHGPNPNLPTPVGTYTLNITAQSSNGITATTHSTTMVLTVTK